MAVKRVVSVRAENGASVPPPMDPSEKMLGMEWRFSGVSAEHTDGVKPPTFYHTYQLVGLDEVPHSGKIEFFSLKDTVGALPTPIPGEVCSTCDGNNSACPVCHPTDPPEGYLD